MSMKQLESSITAELREIIGNKKLRVKDLLEWSTGEISKHDGETNFFLPLNKVYASVKTELVLFPALKEVGTKAP